MRFIRGVKSCRGKHITGIPARLHKKKYKPEVQQRDLKWLDCKTPHEVFLIQVNERAGLALTNKIYKSWSMIIMMNTKNWIGVVALIFAAQVQAGEITVSDAWSRATVPGQEVGMVGLVITSQKDARIIAVTSPVSTTAELHTMTMDNGVMQMRQLENLPLTAKQPATLGPGGNHLMLIGLKQSLKAGDKVPLTLTVQFADKSTEMITFKALVRPLTAGQGQQHH
jgi:periplasmic copper chaperone A